MKRPSLIGIISACLLSLAPVASSSAQSAAKPPRPRIVITADPELDDNNSLIRLLLYSCDLDIEGLIYTSSGFHWKGDGKGTLWYVPGREYNRFGLDTCPCPSWRWASNEHFMDDIVDAYARVYPNLKVQHAGYPDPAWLKSRIRWGNVAFDGDISQNTPGSDLIKALILDDKPGKLFITAWGGQSSIARALKSIQDTYEYTGQWEQLKAKISRKVVLLPSGDQDDCYEKYIKPSWPGIEYRQFRNGPNYSYGAQLSASQTDSLYLTAAWMKENISSRGPLGKLYRVWGDGKQMVKGDIMDYFGFSGYSNDQLRKMGYVVWMPVQEKGSWLGEGDNPTFMNMLDNGLRAFENGTYGGWGGVQPAEEITGNIFAGSADTSQQAMISALAAAGKTNHKEPSAFPDFFPAAQRDFAARLLWSVTPRFSDANHAPRITVEGPLYLLASAGQQLKLHASVKDPDGNAVSVRYWQFRVGTYPGTVTVVAGPPGQAVLQVPADALAGQTIHLIVEATDNGHPALTSYQRILIRVRSK